MVNGLVLETLQQGAPECGWAESCWAAVSADVIIEQPGGQCIIDDADAPLKQLPTASNGAERITSTIITAANLRLRNIT